MVKHDFLIGNSASFVSSSLNKPKQLNPRLNEIINQDYNIEYLNLIQSKNNLSRTGITVILCSIPPLIVTCCELYEYFTLKDLSQLPKSFALELIDHSLQLKSEEQLFYANIKKYLPVSYMQHNNNNVSILIVFIIKTFMQFLNGFLILFLVILSLSYQNNVTNKFSCFFKNNLSQGNTSSNLGQIETSRKIGNCSSNDIYNAPNELSQSFQFKQRCSSSTLPSQNENCFFKDQKIITQFVKKCDCGFNKVSFPIDANRSQGSHCMEKNTSLDLISSQSDHHYCTPHVFFANNSTIVESVSSNQYASSSDLNNTVTSSLAKTNIDSYKITPIQVNMSTFSANPSVHSVTKR